MKLFKTAALMLAGVQMVPESARWLLVRGREEEAVASCSQIYLSLFHKLCTVGALQISLGISRKENQASLLLR